MTVKVSGVDGSSGLDGLAADLVDASRDVLPETRKVEQASLANIKRDWQKTWSGHPKIRLLPNTITYDTRQGIDRVSGEVGPEHGRRGAALANLIEYEFGGVHSAPIPGGGPALDRERPRFERALEDAAARLAEGRR